MADPHVVTALIAKRAELAGKIDKAQKDLRQLAIEMDAIDRALLIFDPDADIMAIQPKPVPVVHRALRGEVKRVILDMLRAAKAPVTSRAIAHKVMKERGLDSKDRPLERLMVKRVGAALRSLRKQGLVTEVLIAGKFMNWELAKP